MREHMYDPTLIALIRALGGSGGGGGTVSADIIYICGADETAEDGKPSVASPDENKIYLVSSGEASPNLFIEWLWVDGAWEKFGSATVDLTGYVKNTDYATSSIGGVVRVVAANDCGFQIESDTGKLRTVKASNSLIDAKTNPYVIISPANLDHAIKVGMTTNTEDLSIAEQNAAQAWLGLNAMVEMASTDVAPTLNPMVFYAFPEIATLTPTLSGNVVGIANEYHFSFISGAIATVLTLPDTVVSDLVVEPNRRYECSIVNNYLAWADWAV